MIDRLNTALEGRYRIERELGAGGMATVYLADDLKHQRKVAIKVLRPELAAVVGADRFLAEIETTANLQHPHILPLFDSGEADTFLFYVMPYVEGESLRDRLQREHQLPVDEAVRIASDVAEALQAAHERGVIHRDIKPANILMSGGRPLVADFGIALAVSNAGGGRLTETGLSMGTPYYMSPEQASADRDPTPASDQYSLACVLYEMLVGEPPFPGGSAQAVLARILTGDPTPPAEVRKSVPENVNGVVMRGLEKLPADRFPDAREMVRALRDQRHRYSTGGHRTGSGSGKGPRGVLLPWALALILLVVAAAGWLTRDSGPRGTEPIRAALPMSDEPIPLGPLLRLGLDAKTFDVASDGRSLVHMGLEDGVVRLYRRSLDSYESEVIAGTEGALDPLLSPDGRWVTYLADEGLWKVQIEGGEPVRLASASNGFNGFWGSDGRIWFNSMEGNRLNSVSPEGGDLRIEAEFDQYVTPFELPNGAGILVSGSDPSRTAAWTREAGIKVLTGGASPRYLPSGHITFVRGRTLYAAGFDLDALELTTPAVPVLEGLRSRGWIASYQISDEGTLFYIPGENAAVVVPALIGSDGSADTLSMPPAEYGHLAISPGLDRIATYTATNEFEVSVFDLESGRAQSLDRAPSTSQVIWSREGDRVAYGRLTEDRRTWELVVRAPGSTRETVVATSDSPNFPSGWSPDDSMLLFSRASAGAGLQIEQVPADGGGEPEVLVGGAADEWGAVISPDGEWMTYTSDRDGGYEIYLTAYPVQNDAESVKISTQPGSEEPHWSFEGDAVIYRSGSQWWRVPVRFAPDPVPGEPELVADGPFINVAGKSWDLLPDGRILVGDGPRDLTVDRIHMIPNFAAEIVRRVNEAGR